MNRDNAGQSHAIEDSVIARFNESSGGVFAAAKMHRTRTINKLTDLDTRIHQYWLK
ncbi:hypothetical protein J8M20_20945 [Pseudoalteromonas luteoviolacea]|uniref:hypothetical protein n=1 Tax=Pseudoalteromonas luteoviolacea TaxID=43657 RepID=UPI00159EFA84|nr:hypothetical protein [Pseudoalteromonas luteoviolacea]MBQ4813845.1 hypothetical protein [Pseudoalteromonas luteoviolacea]